MNHLREGGCQCGAIRYEATGDPAYSALCHCKDCRASAGAPMVAWAGISRRRRAWCPMVETWLA